MITSFQLATTASIVAQFKLSEPAQAALAPNDTPWVFLEKLREASLWQDALRLIAYSLPKRDAVIWACLCVETLETPLPPLQQAALSAARAWISTGGEAERRAAFAASQAAKLDNGAGCAALATFWSGGSMAPEGEPVVPPAENLCHHAAACAAMLVGVSQAEQAATCYGQLVQLGKEMLNANQ